jgi:hypothetical protein
MKVFIISTIAKKLVIVFKKNHFQMDLYCRDDLRSRDRRVIDLRSRRQSLEQHGKHTTKCATLVTRFVDGLNTEIHTFWSKNKLLYKCICNLVIDIKIN